MNGVLEVENIEIKYIKNIFLCVILVTPRLRTTGVHIFSTAEITARKLTIEENSCGFHG